MSAIDLKFGTKTIKGGQVEDRAVMNWNGKFSPHIEQAK
jgi:cyanate lyase